MRDACQVNSMKICLVTVGAAGGDSIHHSQDRAAPALIFCAHHDDRAVYQLTGNAAQHGDTSDLKETLWI